MITNYIFQPEYNDPQNYYWFENGFTKEEIDKIIENFPIDDIQRASTIGGDTSQVRNSHVKWIPGVPEWEWVYEKMMDMAVEANKNTWNFNLHSAPELIQYTVYDSKEKGHYGAHQDIGPGIMSLRKVSITVQLSHPDDYEGGELQITSGGEGWDTMPRGYGNVVVFPSYMMHRVTPVTKGIRRSLVLWVGGEHYK